MSAKFGTYLANRFHWEFSSSATVLTKGQSCWMFLSTARHQGRARPSDVEILHLRHVRSCKAPHLISWLPRHLPMCESGLSSNDSAFWTSMPLRCKLINCMWNYWLHNYRNSKQVFGANIEHMKFSFLLQRDAPPQQLQLVCVGFSSNAPPPHFDSRWPECVFPAARGIPDRRDFWTERVSIGAGAVCKL